MKGYVKVTVEQIQEAITGFTKQYHEGKNVRDIGIERFHKRFFVDEGGWWVKWRCRNMTPSQFVHYHMGTWCRISDVIFKVLSDDEQQKLDFYAGHYLSQIDGLSAMVSQSTDGFALVDSEMAKAINTYRSFI